MRGLTRDETVDPFHETNKFTGANRDRKINIFPVELTRGRYVRVMAGLATTPVDAQSDLCDGLAHIPHIHGYTGSGW